MKPLKQGAKTPRTTTEYLKNITLNTSAFQFRHLDLDETHIWELSSQPIPPKGFDPIDLWREPEEGALVLLDGHHRFEVYKRAGLKSKIPVRIHICSLRDARTVALRENSKVRKSLSQSEKSDAMWTLVQLRKADGITPEYTKAELRGMGLVSDRTIANMRNVYGALVKAEEDIPDTWAEALRSGRDTKVDDEWDRDVWIESRAAELDSKVGRLIGDEFSTCPEAALSVFDKRAGQQGKRVLLDQWGAVAVSNDAEGLDTLAYAMYENLTLEQIEGLVTQVRCMRSLVI